MLTEIKRFQTLIKSETTSVIMKKLKDENNPLDTEIIESTVRN